MRKRILSMMLVFCMVLGLMPTVFAEDTGTSAGNEVASGSCGENLTWTLDEGGTLTISGTGDMTDYWGAEAPWYANRDNITAVVIEDGVTSIGDYAFSNCRSLSSIEIPNGVTSIGEGAFLVCSSLSSIEIPAGVTSIGMSAFVDCGSLSSIEIPASVTSIGDYAFHDCSSLSSIEIPAGVTSIGTAVFYGCSSLSSIEIPTSVTSIGISAFWGCDSLSSIEIPASVTSIGDSAFGDCAGLINIQVAEENQNYCSEDGVLFSKDMTCLYAYPAQKDQTSYQIPDGVTSIGTAAFYGCSSLSSIEIPASVTSIGDSAFSNCSSLSSIELLDGVTSIGDSAFSNCSSLSSIKIPDGVTSIEAGAFDGCSSLSSIELPDGVTSIGDSAFSNCSSLSSIELPASVTNIGAGAFAECTSLNSTEIPSSVSSLAYSVFWGCSQLKTVTLPESLTYIGETAFGECTSLTDTYYGGTAEQWSGISIMDGNDYLTNSTIHYESHGGEDTDTPDDGKVMIQGSDTQYDTLAEAIQAAQGGDTIRLGKGTYTTFGEHGIADGKDLTFIGAGSNTIWQVGPTETADDYADDSLAGAGTVSFSKLELEVYDTEGVGFTGINQTEATSVWIEGRTTSWGKTSAKFENCHFALKDILSGEYLLETGSTKEMTISNCDFSGGNILASGDVDQEAEDGTVYVINMDGTSGHCRICIDDTSRTYQINISGCNPANGVDKRTCSMLYRFTGETLGTNTTVTMNDTVVWENGKLISHEYANGNVITTEGDKTQNDDGSYRWEETTTCQNCGWTETTERTGYRLSGTIEENGYFPEDGEKNKTYEAYAETGNSVWYCVYADDGYVLKDLTVDDQSIPEAINAAWYAGYYSITDHNATISAEFGKQSYYVRTNPFIAGGEVYANVEYAEAGTTVKLAAVPYDGFKLKKYIVTSSDGSETLEITPEQASFVMPAGSVSVSAEFEQVTTGGYLIGISSNIQNGTISVEKNLVQAGDTVTVTVTPNAGYRLRDLYYQCTVDGMSWGEPISKDESGAYTFTMPNINVVLCAIFVLEQSYTLPVYEDAPQVEIASDVKDDISGIMAETEVTGIGGAVDINNILKASEVTDAVEMELYAEVTVTEADLAAQTVTFAVKPVAQVVDLSTASAKRVDISNDMLNGNPITVKLPIPDGMDPKEIVHTSDDGTKEYYTLDGEKRFTIETELFGQRVAVLQVTHFSDFTMNGTVHEHVTKLVNAKEATCTEDGYTGDEVCTDCGVTITESEVIPATGHKNVEIPAVAATCTTDGATAGLKCSVCGEILVAPEKVPAKGHTWDEGKITKKPTVSAEGEKTYTCTVCGKTKTEAIEKLTTCDGGENCPSRNYKDVDTHLWYHLYVDYAIESKLMVGDGGGIFRPNGKLTRAEMAEIMYNVAGKPAVTGKSAFSDVKDDAWYAKAVIWATENGVVYGVGDGKFAPNELVTREQLVTMLYRYAKKPETTGTLDEFADASKISSYAVDAMRWAVQEEIIHGDGGTPRKLRPNDNASRAEIATIMYMYIE